MKKSIPNLLSIVLMLIFNFISINTNGQVVSNIDNDSLIEDTRQLVKILEESHPDPYLNFGGKIAFNRDFQNILLSIPEKGMNSSEYYNLLMPFVAKVADMHTGLINPVKPTQNGPGIPLQFKIVEEDLVVTRVPSKKYKDLLGSRLISVSGIGIKELMVRQTQLRGVENKYGELLFLSISLRTANGIKNLIPEWNSSEKFSVELKMANGKIKENELFMTESDPEASITFPSKQLRPSTEKSDVAYNYIDSKKETALLVVASMERYREASEAWFSDGMDGAKEYTEVAYKHFNSTEPPEDEDELLKGIPSATETFISLISDIKKYNTKNLIVDLRGNTGGNSLMKEMLIYFLFGKEGLISMNQGFQIIKYSELYFNNYASDSLQLINKQQKIMLTKDDYNFGRERKFRENEPDLKLLDEYLMSTPTFWDVYKTKQYDLPSFQLENIIVLCEPITTSSGFNLLTALNEKGAKILGTASAQPGNNFGDVLFFQLRNSKLAGYVSFKQNVTFPDDSVKGKCLMPDYPLTYLKFKSLGFNADAEIEYAVEVLKE